MSNDVAGEGAAGQGRTAGTRAPAEGRSAGSDATADGRGVAADDAVAATVVLLRDGERGPEVLLLERPTTGSFPGAWVFPGGAVEPADVTTALQASAPHPPGASSPSAATQPPDGPAEQTVALAAAVRETREETGLALAAELLVPQACWVPPQGVAKRMRTWFFLAVAPAGDVVLAAAESVAHEWMRPGDALDRHAEERLLLFPPTWVTLHGLREARSAEDALGRAREDGVRRFSSRFAADRRTIFWEGDVGYTDDALAAGDGRRHRLEMHERPWVYRRD